MFLRITTETGELIEVEGVTEVYVGGIKAPETEDGACMVYEGGYAEDDSPIEEAEVKMKRGTRVIFTVDELGTTEHPDGTRFAEPIVMSGHKGSYYGPHRDLDGWHIIGTIAGGRYLYCPVHETHFKAVPVPDEQLDSTEYHNVDQSPFANS